MKRGIKAQVVKLAPTQDGLIVLRLDERYGRLSGDKLEGIAKCVNRLLDGCPCPIVILPPGMALTELSRDDLETLGLARIE